MVFDIATLDGLAADIGAPVPDGDPGAIFALADQLEASARAWEDNAEALARLRSRLRSVLVGDTGDGLDQHLAQLLHGPDSLQGDSEAVRAGVAALRNYGADLQDNQWTSRMLAVWLLATMIWGVASVIATGGESLVEVAVARVRTAAAINALKEMLWRRIAAILTELLVNAGRAVLLGGAQQLVVQGLQVAMGDRTGLNGHLVAGTGLSFAEFGVGAEAVEHGVLGLVADAAKDSPAASVAGWATSKASSGMAGNTVATLAGGGPITPETLWTGAAVGGAGALADARGKGASVAAVHEPTETAVAADAIDTHPTLRFEKQSDGTFAWPGETTNDAGPQAHTALAPTTTSEPAVAAGELSAAAPAGHGWSDTADPVAGVGDRVSGAASHGSPDAGDLGARSVEGATAGRVPAQGDMAGQGPRSSEAPPAAGIAAWPADAITAAGGPTPPDTTTALQDGRLDLSTTPPPAPAAASPTADHIAGFESPSPATDVRAGRADSSSSDKSGSEPAGVPAARAFDTTAANQAASVTHDTRYQTTLAGQAGETGVDRFTQTAPSRAATDSAAVEAPAQTGAHGVVSGRDESPPAGKQRIRSRGSVTQRQDPNTRPDGSRPPGKPGPLRRSGVAHDSGEPLAGAVALVGACRDDAADPSESRRLGVDDIQARHDQGDGNGGDNTQGPSPGPAGDDGAGGGSRLPSAATPPDPQRPRSREEQDFLDWYQARDPLPEGKRQSLAQYAAMTGIDKVQMRRWLPGIGVDPAVVDIVEVLGRIPDPTDFVAGKDWLVAVRRYLVLNPQQMDRLIGAAEAGTWAFIEFGGLQATTEQVRALLRRVPEARTAYVSVGRRFPEFGLLTDNGEARWPEGYEYLHEYLKSLRIWAGLSLRGFAETTTSSAGPLSHVENGRSQAPRRDLIDAYLRLGGAATYAELAGCFDPLPLDDDQLRFPSLTAVERLSEYVRYLRRVNKNLTDADAGRLLGLPNHGLGQFLDLARHQEVTVLRIWRRVLHRAGPYNDLAAWGYRYRMDPAAGDVFPRPVLFNQLRDWALPVRVYHALSPQQFAARTGLTVAQISSSEREHGYTPEQLRMIHNAGLISDHALQEALNRFHFAPANYTADAVGLGRWLKELRLNAGMSQRRLAVATGRRAHSQAKISEIENGTRAISPTVAHGLCVALGVSDELWEQARGHFFPPADTTPANYPADGVGLGRWLATLRRNAGFTTQEQFADARGISESYVSSIESGQFRPRHTATRALAVALGVSDELWEQARAHFFPPADTTPANHTLGSWLTAHRNNADLTESQLATDARVSPRHTYAVTHDEYTPSLRTFRRLCDGLNIHGPTRLEAISHFYTNRYPTGADPADEQLFWRLVDTKVDSPQERELRNQIYEGDPAIAGRRPGYAWIAKHAAHRWAATAADRDELEQVARVAILTAIVNHTPSGSFIAHAFAGCRGAIRGANWDARYPDLDRRTRRLVSTVSTHLGRVDPAAPTPHPADVAADLRLNPADVARALQILSQPTISIDQPTIGPRGGVIKRQRPLTDPTATTAFADTDFAATVRTALADLPDPDTATRLVILHLVDGAPLDQEPEPENGIPPGAAQQLGLSVQTAAEIICTAIPRLRTAFQPPPSDDAHT